MTDADLTADAVRLLTRWRTQQIARSLSRRTIDERERIVRAFAASCNGAPHTASTDQVAAWLAEGDMWASTTRATYWSILRAWFDWLATSGVRDDNPLAALGKLRRPRGTPHPVDPTCIHQLTVGRMWPTTRAYVQLASLAGLRVHEIAKIRGEDVDLSARTLRVTGKGGRTDVLPLHPRLVELAQEMPRSGWWFPSDHRSGHVTGKAVGERIGDLMRRKQIRGTAHSLRHTFATELVRGGADLRTVQTLLRHSSLATTQIYVGVADEQRERAIASLQFPTGEPT